MTTETRQELWPAAGSEFTVPIEHRDEIVGAVHQMFEERGLSPEAGEVSTLLGLLVGAEVSSSEDEVKLRMDILQAVFREKSNRCLPRHLALNGIYHLLRARFSDKLISFHED